MTLLLLLWACTKPCEFTARCDGDVLETCSVGVDQLVGSGISRTDCTETVNPVCVTHGDDAAQCAMERTPTCDLPEPQCDGDVILACSAGYLVADDCALAGPTCVTHPDDGAPVCAVDPVTSCDRETFLQTCATEDSVYACLDGVVTELDCDLTHEKATCKVRNGGAGCSRD